MTLPVLYSFRRCPYAMRARMALDAAGTDLEHREVLLRDKPEAMLRVSPKGTVPVLVTQDGVIEESLDIMEWALDQSDPEDWSRHLPNDRRRADAFLDVFKDALDRYKYASRYDDTKARGDTDPEQRKIAMDALLNLSATLEDAPWLGGETPSLLDIATFPFVRQFAAVEPDWWTDTAPRPLEHWLQTWLKSPRFKRIMTKHPVWSEG